MNKLFAIWGLFGISMASIVLISGSRHLIIDIIYLIFFCWMFTSSLFDEIRKNK